MIYKQHDIPTKMYKQSDNQTGCKQANSSDKLCKSLSGGQTESFKDQLY